MEHWSNTSSVEPLPLGRGSWLTKQKKEEVGFTSTDQCHYSKTSFHKGQKAFPFARFPHEGSKIQVEHVNSTKLVRKNMTISSLDNGVNQKVAEKNGTISTADEENGAHRERIQEKFIEPRPSSQGKKSYQKNVSVTARDKAKEILREFGAYCDLILKMDYEDNKNKRKRVDFLAAKMIKKKFCYYPDRPFLGQVPGVEIGDKFYYRMELNILGLHRPSQGGIDYMQDEGRIVAISVVDSGGYDNYMANQETLIYCGQGGNNTHANVGLELAEDQKLKGGNLALMNSIRAKNPVRVIRGCQVLRASTSYFYDGLYTVEKMWEDKGLKGKRVFKFKLVKMPGQVNFLSR